MLHNPRDSRLTATKIIHDYQLKCVTPNVIRVYYDIETAVFGKNEVPQHTDRNAFISMISLVVLFPDGRMVK